MWIRLHGNHLSVELEESGSNKVAAQGWKKGNREVVANRSKDSARQNEESSGELVHNVAVVCIENLLKELNPGPVEEQYMFLS